MQILHVAPAIRSACGGITRDCQALAAELIKSGEQSLVTEQVDQIEELAGKCDILHLHGLWTPQNRVAGKAARRLGKPYVVSAHGMMLPDQWNGGRWKKLPDLWLYERKNLRAAARLHALNDAEARNMKTLGFNARIQTIPLGVNVSEFERLPGAESLIARFPEFAQPRWVLFLGRIHPQKGVVQAMQACFDVLAKADGWHLIIAGPDDAAIQPMLQAAVSRKGLSDRVTFTGLLSQEESRAALGRASVLLQPSMSEGQSMSITEALAAGKPVIISDACNMPEVVASGAGKIVPSIRAAIASALREVVGMGEGALGDMGRQARALAAQKYDWSKLRSQYREMYAAAMS